MNDLTPHEDPMAKPLISGSCCHQLLTGHQTDPPTCDHAMNGFIFEWEPTGETAQIGLPLPWLVPFRYQAKTIQKNSKGAVVTIHWSRLREHAPFPLFGLFDLGPSAPCRG